MGTAASIRETGGEGRVPATAGRFGDISTRESETRFMAQHPPEGKGHIKAIHSVAREPGAAAGWLVRLILGKTTTQLKWLRL